MPDPSAVYVDAGVEVGRDTVLWPGTHLRGRDRRRRGLHDRPGRRDDRQRDRRRLHRRLAPTSSAPSSPTAPASAPSPTCAPARRLERGARAGTYVELKNTTLGPAAKVPHLSYVGDATVGEGTNIGAGNITANYDGFRKHRTDDRRAGQDRLGLRVRRARVASATTR